MSKNERDNMDIDYGQPRVIVDLSLDEATQLLYRAISAPNDSHRISTTARTNNEIAVTRLADALADADPTHADAYREYAHEYRNER